MSDYDLTVEIKQSGFGGVTSALGDLRTQVSTTAAAVSDDGQKISTAAAVTAADVRNAASSVVSAIELLRSKNAASAQGISADITGAAKNITSAIGQIKAANEANTQAIVAAVNRIGEAMSQTARDYNKAVDEMASKNEELQGKALGLKDALGNLAAAWAGTAAARGFISSTLEAAASMESLEKAFKAAGGTIEQFEEVKEMAANTPVIDAQAAVSAVSTLARMGYSIDEAKGKVQTLANAAAYFGKSSADMERAMAQIEQLAGKTTGFSGDLNAIQSSLPDVKQRLNQAFGTETVEQIQELGVTGQEVAKKLIESYESLPEISAGTQEGLDQLEASFTEIRAELGKAFIPALQLTASVIGKVANGIKSMPDWAKTLTAWAIAGGAVAVAVYNIVKAVNAARRAWQGLITLQALSQALKGPAGIAAVVAGTAVAVGGMTLTNAYLNKKHEEDEAKGASEDDAAIAAIRQEAAANVSGLEASTKPQAAAAKADKDAAKEAAKALKDSEKEKARALKDAEKQRAEALKAEAKAEEDARKAEAKAAQDSVKAQEKYYTDLAAALEKQADEREAASQKAIDAAIKERDTILGLYSKGQTGYLASWVSGNAMQQLKAQSEGADIRQTVRNSAYDRETDSLRQQADAARKQAELLQQGLQTLQQLYNATVQNGRSASGLLKLATKEA